MKNNMLSAIRSYLYLAILPFILSSFGLPPKEKEVSVSGKINLNQDYLVYIVGKNSTASLSEELKLTEDGRFNWKGKANAPFFLNIGFFPASKSYQMPARFIVLVQPGKHIDLELNYSKETYLTLVKGNLDAGNAALFSYSVYNQQKAYDLWKNAPVADKRKEVCWAYIAKAESLIKENKVTSDLVKQYLKIWSHNSYLDAMSSFASSDRRGVLTSATATDWYPSDATMKLVYDNSMALQIPSSLSNMAAFVNATHVDAEKSQNKISQLESQILGVKQVFQNNQVRDALITGMLEKYTRGYRVDNAAAFEDAVMAFNTLTAHVTDEGIKAKLVESFSGLRFTMVGADMPDVVLRDINNNEVSLPSFKGKYVYIDLWASWCVPCIQEVPALQQLEKDYAGANITFLSLTLDANKDAWKKKMEELNMHGNQLDAADSGLDKLMNVTGIPRFLLYDADGKLMLLNAPRPSSTQIRQVFDNIK